MSLMDSIRRPKEEAPAPPSHKGTLFIAGSGTFVWDTADPISVEEMRDRFKRAIRAGYMAQAYGGTAQVAGYSGQVTRSFEPEADEIRMTLPYAGG